MALRLERGSPADAIKTLKKNALDSNKLMNFPDTATIDNQDFQVFITPRRDDELSLALEEEHTYNHMSFVPGQGEGSLVGMVFDWEGFSWMIERINGVVFGRSLFKLQPQSNHGYGHNRQTLPRTLTGYKSNNRQRAGTLIRSQRSERYYSVLQ